MPTSVGSHLQTAESSKTSNSGFSFQLKEVGKETGKIVLAPFVALASIATAGQFQALNQFANEWTKGEGDGRLAELFKFILLKVNSGAEIGDGSQFPFADMRESEIEAAEACRDSKNIFAQQVGSRLLYTVALIKSIFPRAVFSILIGVTYGVLSIVTLGSSEEANSLAYHSIKEASLIVNDLYYNLVHIVNPWADLGNT